MSVDYFGKNSDELKGKKLFLFDMDGTIYEEEKLFDGTLQLLDYINSIGGHYVFITNNSSKSVTDYVKKVNRLGIAADKNNFFTSSQATILYIKKNYAGMKIYCQGTKSFVKELLDGGINVTEEVEDGIGLVVVGFDTELTSQKLRNTCEILQRDIPFIATNPDLACPVNFGFVPDCGSICMMLENATKRKPVYVGKPEATMINIVMEMFACSKEETVVVGDRLYTDIASGLNAGVTAVCVLTGEATENEIHDSNYIPSFTFKSIKELWTSVK